MMNTLIQLASVMFTGSSFLSNCDRRCAAHSPVRRLHKLVGMMSLAALTVTTWVTPSLAGDPFRSSNPKTIGTQVEAAFTTVFAEGNYPKAQEYLNRAEANEPMTYALRASLAYSSQNFEDLRVNAIRTQEVANQLLANDPLRGHLYLAVGYFLEGAYILVSDGTVRGTPKALGKLQEVFKQIKAAEKIDKTDPELNMIKGFMDLMIAVNLPFADPAQAVERLENYASPRYLANRGIALGYRDLGKFDKALDYINRAIQETPDNPELHYTKAQILVLQGQPNEAAKSFKLALAKPEQLPRTMVWQMFFEYCNTQNKVDNQGRNCVDLRDRINLQAGIWGPTSETMPKL